MESQSTKKINYPSEITFKSIFRNKVYTYDCIKTIMAEYDLKGDIDNRVSKNGKFISYTITAIFKSDKDLQRVCSKISTLEGFMMMF